jgi:hypothetical protein
VKELVVLRKILTLTQEQDLAELAQYYFIPLAVEVEMVLARQLLAQRQLVVEELLVAEVGAIL